MALARDLQRRAQQAGHLDFSLRASSHLAAGLCLLPGIDDLFATLAGQPAGWPRRAGPVAGKNLERAVRRAEVAEGRPARQPGRKRRRARVMPTDTSPDLDIRVERDALMLAAMSDGIDEALAVIAREVELPDPTAVETIEEPTLTQVGQPKKRGQSGKAQRKEKSA